MSIRHSLLALLSTGPMYGQQLKSEFEIRTGDLWPLNVGQVYTTLGRLERDGLVEARPEADVALRPYTITALGQAELATWFRAVPGDEPPPRDELVMKVMLAASVDPAGSADVIQSHRRQTLEAMHRFTRLKGLEEATVATMMMCDAELFRLEAAVRWLDSVEARLRSGARLTPAVPAVAATAEADAGAAADAEAQTSPVAGGRRKRTGARR